MVALGYVDRDPGVIGRHDIGSSPVHLGSPALLHGVGHHQVPVAIGGHLDLDAGGGVHQHVDRSSGSGALRTIGAEHHDVIGQLACGEHLEPVERLDLDDRARAHLHLMPTCGTRYYRYDDGGDLVQVYAHDLTAEERTRATETLESEARRLGLWETETWGPVLEDRGSQITFSALGQRAPLEPKRAWDPTGEKKEQLRAAVAPLLPELEVRSGGSTSVDITRSGVDKAYGMTRLAEHTGIAVASRSVYRMVIRAIVVTSFVRSVCACAKAQCSHCTVPGSKQGAVRSLHPGRSR